MVRQCSDLNHCATNTDDSRWPSLADTFGRFSFVLIRTADNARVLDAYAAAVLNGTVEPLLFLEQRGRPTSNLVVFNEASGNAEAGSSSSSAVWCFSFPVNYCQLDLNVLAQDLSAAAVARGMIVRAFAGSVPAASQLAALLDAGVQHIASDVVPGATGDSAALRDALLARGMHPRCLARCAASVAANGGAGACADLAALCDDAL